MASHPWFENTVTSQHPNCDSSASRRGYLRPTFWNDSLDCTHTHHHNKKAGRRYPMHEDGDTRRLTRRHFLKVGGGALAGAYALGLAGCGGGGQASGELTFFSWNIESDLRSFRALIKKYEKQHPDVSINL